MLTASNFTTQIKQDLSNGAITLNKIYVIQQLKTMLPLERLIELLTHQFNISPEEATSYIYQFAATFTLSENNSQQMIPLLIQSVKEKTIQAGQSTTKSLPEL